MRKPVFGEHAIEVMDANKLAWSKSNRDRHGEKESGTMEVLELAEWK